MTGYGGRVTSPARSRSVCNPPSCICEQEAAYTWRSIANSISDSHCRFETDPNPPPPSKSATVLSQQRQINLPNRDFANCGRGRLADWCSMNRHTISSKRTSVVVRKCSNTFGVPFGNPHSSVGTPNGRLATNRKRLDAGRTANSVGPSLACGPNNAEAPRASGDAVGEAFFMTCQATVHQTSGQLRPIACVEDQARISIRCSFISSTTLRTATFALTA